MLARCLAVKRVAKVPPLSVFFLRGAGGEPHLPGLGGGSVRPTAVDGDQKAGYVLLFPAHGGLINVSLCLRGRCKNPGV